MKLYGFSGLGADERVFKFLSLNCKFIPIKWIKPISEESIEEYSLRISKIINTDEEFGLLGVSFGGLIAVEVSKILTPKITILISSAETYQDLPFLIRLFGFTKVINILPKTTFRIPPIIAQYFFSTPNKTLLKAILKDSDLDFTKWAIKELSSWKNVQYLSQSLKISGSKDKVIPPKKNRDIYIIEDGGHFMIVDKADEVSSIINQCLISKN